MDELSTVDPHSVSRRSGIHRKDTFRQITTTYCGAPEMTDMDSTVRHTRCEKAEMCSAPGETVLMVRILV